MDKRSGVRKSGRRNGRMSEKRKRMRRLRRLIICGFICALLFIIWIFTYFSFRKYVKTFPEKEICAGISVGGIDVSGMTKKEAAKAVEAKLNEYRTAAMTFQVHDAEAAATFEELGLSIKKMDGVVQEAVDYGKKGSMWSRYWSLKKLKKEKKNFEVTYAVDKEKTTAVLKERAMPLEKQAVNATLKREGDSLEIVEGKKGTNIDVGKTISNLNQYLNENWKPGKAGSLKAVSVKEKPKVTAKDLEEVKDVLGTYTTTYGADGSGRSQNIETASRLLNGTVLMPGEEYSVNSGMEPYTEENGYAKAGSYENGAVVQTMGGGICQVSSTLYNAFLLAEIEILERYPHSMTVSYVPPSLDAAIAEDLLDLKVKNNYDTPIFIESYTANGDITFTIYGKETRDPNRSIAYESEIISEADAEEGNKYVATYDEWIGSMYTSSAGHRGMEARSWKIVYENGEEVSREIYNYSHYQASQATVLVGVNSDNPEKSNLVLDAVATQDEAAIKAAIEQAEGM